MGWASWTPLSRPSCGQLSTWPATGSDTVGSRQPPAGGRKAQRRQFQRRVPGLDLRQARRDDGVGGEPQRHVRIMPTTLQLLCGQPGCSEVGVGTPAVVAPTPLTVPFLTALPGRKNVPLRFTATRSGQGPGVPAECGQRLLEVHACWRMLSMTCQALSGGDDDHRSGVPPSSLAANPAAGQRGPRLSATCGRRARLPMAPRPQVR
jgi:hypothetical protein